MSNLGLAAGKPVPPADVRQGAVLEDDVPALELIRIWFGESAEDEGTRTKLVPKGNLFPVAPTLPSPDIVISGESVAAEFKRTTTLPSPELMIGESAADELKGASSLPSPELLRKGGTLTYGSRCDGCPHFCHFPGGDSESFVEVVDAVANKVGADESNVEEAAGCNAVGSDFGTRQGGGSRGIVTAGEEAAGSGSLGCQPFPFVLPFFLVLASRGNPHVAA